MKIQEKRAKSPVSKIYPCSMCGKTVKANAIECTACKVWVHKRRSEIRDALTRVKYYECGCCKGFHNDKEEVKYIKLGNDMIEVVQEFCYLGGVVGSIGDV